MNRACENKFRQLYLIKINKINIFMIAEVEKIMHHYIGHIKVYL